MISECQTKDNCCGCSACAQICPKHCISMVEDKEGFLYPIINEAICVKCNKCDKVCPFLNKNTNRMPINDFAVINKDEQIRQRSSSGGVFISIASFVIKKGGVVFGVAFDEDWNAIHTYSDNLADLEKFLGSKYVQSKIGDSYETVEQALKSNRIVLFSGTPCQVLGLKNYLGKNYDNLLTIDFICHGVPSPLVWRKYLKEFDKTIGNISFRDKSEGWNHFSLRIEDNDSNVIYKQIFQKDPYMQLFLNNYILRPSCYNCKVRGGKSKSDITLADFWNIQNVAPDYYDDKGTSLVLVNTLKGAKYFEMCDFIVQLMTHDEIIQYNMAWYKSYEMPINRNKLFNELKKYSINSLYIRYLHPDYKISNRIKRRIIRFFHKVKEYTDHSNCGDKGIF